MTRRAVKLDDEGRHAVSVVTVTEVRRGVNERCEAEDDRRRASEALDRSLARFDVLAVSRPVAVAAAEVISSLERRGAPSHDLHDVYIGATARVE
ncbi:type II toxin-antitoxin system VapC family toxin [Halovivax sp.]|uniref:type II toxin-antitoxin system VapC family toxin n=1 Tax=Halovivax sp. TaxID=1935978 RepID=UPI0025BF3D62|nr:PIN domain-containing protein [Halovivax sp.]